MHTVKSERLRWCLYRLTLGLKMETLKGIDGVDEIMRYSSMGNVALNKRII